MPRSESTLAGTLARALGRLTVVVAALATGPAAAYELLISNNTTNNVLAYDFSTLTFSTRISGASGPMTVGPDGNIYIRDATFDGVDRYNGATGAFMGNFIAPGSGGLDSTRHLRFDPDGYLYVVSQDNDRVLRFNGATGAFVDTFVTANSGGLVFPRASARDPASGDLFVTNPGGYNIVRYDGTTGAFVSTLAPGLDGGPLNSGPDPLVVGPDGNLYVGEATLGRVRRYAPNGADLGVFVSSGSGGLSGPTALAFGPDGLLYVSGAFSNNVLRYDGTTGAFVDVFASGANGVALPAGIAFLFPSTVPEPGTLALLLFAAAGFALRRRANRPAWKRRAA